MEMTVLPPVDEADRGKPQHDKAKDGYSIRSLERLLTDCEEQPSWRATADMCCAYYDGKQLTAQQEFEFRQNQLEPRVVNLIQRVINGVLGQEAKSRRDPHLEPDDDDGADVADVLNVKLKEAQRETCADMAISNGYAGQVKAGLGWVEVSRVADPRLYPYRVCDVHRSEMWWDWRAKKIDLSDARWLVRRQWKDLDEAIAEFPEHREDLEHCVDNWARWLIDDLGDERLKTNQWFQADRAFSVNRSEWMDGGRRRVRMYEVWYRVPAQVVMMQVGQRWIIVDERNPLHMEAIARKMVKLKKAVTSQVRKAIFVGPYRLIDEPTDSIRFPYVPFFAFRADSDNTPYGLIHGMIAPQDEYNERRMRIQWMLKAQQLEIDSDALDSEYNTIEDIALNMMRPDMVAVMNPKRLNGQYAMKFRNDFQLQKEQFDLMQDSKQLIQDVPGVYATQLGDAPTGVTSGLAINSLVEQGIVAMGELNDNYVHARRLVYDLLVDLIAEDHAEHDLQVAIGSGNTRRVVVLNTIDPQTKRAVNVVADAKVTTGLAEVPASPAYQMQMSQMMGDMIRALAGMPQAALMLPAYVETTSSFGPGRKQLADDMRRMSGLPTAGDRQGAQQWQQQQQQQAAKQAALQQAATQVEIQGKAAKAGLDQAKTAESRAVTALTLFQADTLANQPNEASLIDEAIAEAAMVFRESRPGPAAPGVA